MNTLLEHHSPLIEDLAVILCVAGLVTILCQKIRQPIVLGYLLAGMIIGPYTPPFSFIDDETEIRTIAELGVIFLMFFLGLHFSFRKLTKIGFSALIIALVEVFLMILIGYHVGFYLNFNTFESLLLGAALSISSTTIIIKAFEGLEQMKEYYVQLMVGILLVEDFLAILLMVFVSTSAQGVGTSSIMLEATLELMGIIISWFLIGYLAIPLLMHSVRNLINDETLTVVSMGMCLFLSSLAIYFNYSPALGAFIMGSIIAVTPQAEKIEHLMLPMRNIFAAVFFVSVGMLINPSTVYNYWPYILLLSVITIVGKIFTSALGALISGQSVTTAIKVGFSMAQIGEFSFIIIGLGGAVSYVDKALYPIVVAISVITTFTTPHLISFAIQRSDKIQNALPARIKKALQCYAAYVKTPQAKMVKNHRESKEILRCLLNAIIMAIIFMTTANFVLPKFVEKYGDYLTVQFVIWFLTLVAISPFLWALMAHVGMKSTPRQASIRMLAYTLVSTEFIFLLQVLNKSLIWPLALVFIFFMMAFSKELKIIYEWLENHLVENLTAPEDEDEALTLAEE